MKSVGGSNTVGRGLYSCFYQGAKNSRLVKPYYRLGELCPRRPFMVGLDANKMIFLSNVVLCILKFKHSSVAFFAIVIRDSRTKGLGKF